MYPVMSKVNGFLDGAYVNAAAGRAGERACSQGIGVGRNCQSIELRNKRILAYWSKLPFLNLGTQIRLKGKAYLGA